jgi:hypothetical protein
MKKLGGLGILDLQKSGQVLNKHMQVMGMFDWVANTKGILLT